MFCIFRLLLTLVILLRCRRSASHRRSLSPAMPDLPDFRRLFGRQRILAFWQSMALIPISS